MDAVINERYTDVETEMLRNRKVMMEKGAVIKRHHVKQYDPNENMSVYATTQNVDNQQVQPRDIMKIVEHASTRYAFLIVILIEDYVVGGNKKKSSKELSQLVLEAIRMTNMNNRWRTKYQLELNHSSARQVMFIIANREEINPIQIKAETFKIDNESDIIMAKIKYKDTRFEDGQPVTFCFVGALFGAGFDKLNDEIPVHFKLRLQEFHKTVHGCHEWMVQDEIHMQKNSKLGFMPFLCIMLGDLNSRIIPHVEPSTRYDLLFDELSLELEHFHFHEDHINFPQTFEVSRSDQKSYMTSTEQDYRPAWVDRIAFHNGDPIWVLDCTYYGISDPISSRTNHRGVVAGFHVWNKRQWYKM